MLKQNREILFLSKVFVSITVRLSFQIGARRQHPTTVAEAERRRRRL